MCCRDAERLNEQLLPESALPLLLPGSTQPEPLPLFAAAATQGAGASGSGSTGAPVDSVFFVGGPVWTLEWCPWAGAVEPNEQYLAVRARRHCAWTAPVQHALSVTSDHPPRPARLCWLGSVSAALTGMSSLECTLLQLLPAVRPDARRAAQVAAHGRKRQTNRIGQRVGGPASLQIWEVPRPGNGDKVNGGLPRMALAVNFPSGGVVWDAKWCPSPACALPAADGSLPWCASCWRLLQSIS